MNIRVRSELERRVAAFLKEHVPPGSPLLVAVSGGADSLALLHAVRSLPYALYGCHVDHGLRAGAAADRRFVQALARRWHIPLRIFRERVRAFARRHGLGIEEAARQCRYRALARAARSFKCRYVLTAHQAGDQAETVLMNFLRGSGPAGLAGIPRSRALTPSVRVLRPLLEVPKADAQAYLRTLGLRWREDPTNRSFRHHRNRIRLETLPSLERFYPGLSQRLAQNAEIHRVEEDFWARVLAPNLAKTVRKNGKTLTVDLTHLFRYHKALGRRILRHLLPGSSFQDIERIFSLAQSPQDASRWDWAAGWIVKRRGRKLIMTPAKQGRLRGNE